MRIILSEILEREEPVVRIAIGTGDVHLGLPEEEGRLDSIEGAVLSFNKELPGKVSMSGQALAKLIIPCSRCLKDVQTQAQLLFEYDFRIEDGVPENDPEDPLDALSDGIIDVDALFLSEIRQALPTKVLCQKGCRGLCPKCGQDLNIGECGCDRFVPDPRMQKLLDVFSGE